MQSASNRRSGTDAVTSDLGGLRVLVVEDDPDSRDCLCELLRLLRVEVSHAGDGDDGFAAFLRARPDVVLSDLYMPRVGGFELVRRIRALPMEEGGLTPAIAITAGGETEQETLLAGFHALFRKPCDASALVCALASFVEAKRAACAIAMGRRDDGAPPSTWTVIADGEVLRVTLRGHVRTDVSGALCRAMAAHLERGVYDLVADLRGITSVDAAAANVAEREFWPLRHRLRSVKLHGGTRFARLAARAACGVLGVPCVLGDVV